MKRIFLCTLLLLCGISTLSAREVYILNNDWKFFFKDENSSDQAREVSLPHTWNLDALMGGNSYLQTTANYQRSLHIPSAWKGKRLFLRFNGAQSVADVFINGRHIGEHHGGYTAFTFEITHKVWYGSDNSLLVVVSNAYRNDVLPTSSEANIYGGLYRDVELIVTEQTTISPLYYGTEGILVHQTSVSEERVSGRVEVALLGSKDSMHDVTLDILAPDGYVSLSKSVKAKIDGKLLSIPFAIDNPELWSPTQPRLYTARVTIGNESVEVTTGFRSIEVTTDKKFEINGRRIRIHGVTLHHDRMPSGNAITNKEYNADLALIREVGANAIRSTTGPHAQHLYNECDRLGILVWIDFPLTRAPFLSDIAYYSTARFEENGMQQMREIVLQNINHPSVAMWGVFSMMRGTSSVKREYIKRLNSATKNLDTTRPTVACSNQDGEINFITDLIVWQQSVGWSKGEVTDIDIWQGALRKHWGHLKQAISYGEGGIIGSYGDAHAMPTQRINLSVAQHQARFHEGYTRLVDEDLFWGVWVNSMFDFGSTRYTRGVRNTGLVKIDHSQRRDLFYLYKSLWNHRNPTLHITGKSRDIRADEEQVITVYSSAGVPTLTINGDTVKMNSAGRCIYRTDKLKLKGNNAIVGYAGNNVDSMRLTIGNYLKRR